MELYDAMSTLRAVRRLRPDPIPEDVLQRVLTAATWAPSGGNRQPWRAIVVRERDTLAELGKLYSARWSAYAASHRADLATLPDTARARVDRTFAAGDQLSERFADTPALVVFCFNPEYMAVTDSEQPRVSVVGGGSVYPAVQNLLLACRSEGLGCVLTTLLCEDEPRVRELLRIPDPWYTAAAVPIGYPEGGGHGKITRRAIDQMFYADRWEETLALG